MTRPPGSDPPAPSPAAAGDFDAWLEAFGRALDRGEPMDVPCGDCNACCRSGQFVHVEADETDTLARIPEDLLFPAPGSPGARVMGYDEAGRCPMLKAARAASMRTGRGPAGSSTAGCSPRRGWIPRTRAAPPSPTAAGAGGSTTRTPRPGTATGP